MHYWARPEFRKITASGRRLLKTINYLRGWSGTGWIEKTSSRFKQSLTTRCNTILVLRGHAAHAKLNIWLDGEKSDRLISPLRRFPNTLQTSLGLIVDKYLNDFPVVRHCCGGCDSLKSARNQYWNLHALTRVRLHSLWLKSCPRDVAYVLSNTRGFLCPK